MDNLNKVGPYEDESDILYLVQSSIEKELANMKKTVDNMNQMRGNSTIPRYLVLFILKCSAFMNLLSRKLLLTILNHLINSFASRTCLMVLNNFHVTYVSILARYTRDLKY